MLQGYHKHGEYSSRDFHFGRPDQNPYTPISFPHRKISSPHVLPAPNPRRSARVGTGALDSRALCRHLCALAPFRRRISSVSGRPLSSRHRQRPDPPQHVAEQPPGQMPFRQQEPVVPGVLHQPAPGLHQPLLETRERPALDPRRQDQSAPEVGQVVGQDAQLQAYLVRPEPMARQPRPVGRLLAFFDPLLCGAALSCALGFSWTLNCERVLAGGVSR